MSIPIKIEKLMKEKDITKYRLSKESGVPYTTLNQILSQRTKSPQIESLSLIADYFGVSVDYLLGQSVKALIEERLKTSGMMIEDLAEKANVPIGYLRNIDRVDPIEPDYDAVTRIAEVLGIQSRELCAALARQEPPAYDGPRSTVEEDFADEDFEQDVREKEGHHIPSWSTSKDKRDFKKMLEEDAPVMFDGVPLDEEDKEKVLKVMEAIFWDAKKKNKRKPIEE